MKTVFDGVRRGDVVLAVALTALGVLLMVLNVLGGEDGTRVDSHSWWSMPVFALATAPVLWRRRGMLGVCLVTTAALGLHVLAFGWLVRCGAGLPLAIALAYGAGRLSIGWRSVAGLVLTLGIQVLVLVEDSAAGLGIVPVTALAGVAAWGVGVWLRRQASHAAAGSGAAQAPAHA